MNPEGESHQQPKTADNGTGRGRSHPFDWAVAVGATDELWQKVAERVERRRRALRRLILGGAAAVMMVCGGLWWSSGFSFRLGIRDTWAGSAGQTSKPVLFQPGRQLLEDGTVVELQSEQGIRSHFSATERRVVLLSGRAHFQVQPDSRRPFIVQVDGMEVRAVGTAFMVGYLSEQVEVLVTQGKVAVEPRSVQPSPAEMLPPAKAVVLEAGKYLALDRPASAEVQSPSLRPVDVSEQDIAAKLAWRIPRVELAQTPLVDALPVFERYSNVRIILADPTLGQIKISGLLSASNVATLISLLEEEHGLGTEWRGDREVVLRPPKLPGQSARK